MFKEKISLTQSSPFLGAQILITLKLWKLIHFSERNAAAINLFSKKHGPNRMSQTNKGTQQELPSNAFCQHL